MTAIVFVDYDLTISEDAGSMYVDNPTCSNINNRM